MTDMTDEILTVDTATLEEGEWFVKCPHCKVGLYLESGPIRGEQFQHRGMNSGCQGWFEVASNARLVGV